MLRPNTSPRPKIIIEHFTLPGILPDQYQLAFNSTLGTLALLAPLTTQPALPPVAHMVLEQQFSSGEASVLRGLLEAYPNYCSLEALLSYFHDGKVTEALLEQHRTWLHAAIEDGSSDHILKPLRNILWRIRLKLRPFRIGVSALVEVGYQLGIDGRLSQEDE